jgi:hypothetical protein
MIDHKQVLILSVPHCEPYPMLAPILLSGCLNEAGISAKGIDFSIAYTRKFENYPELPEMKNFITMGEFNQPDFSLAWFKEIYRFTKNFLIDLNTKHQPEYIGLSIFSTESLDFGLFMSYLIRKYCPGVKIMAGGKGLETPEQGKHKRHYEIWDENGVADLIIIGDGEYEIISSVREGKTGVVKAVVQTQEDLDNIPLARFDEYNFKDYTNLQHLVQGDRDEYKSPYISITASKGCIRKCTFCDVPTLWPKYVFRDPAKVADEIVHAYKNTGITWFRFTDNLINGSISNFRKMNQLLVERIPRTIKYDAFAIFRGKNDMPEEDFWLAAEAGAERFAIGVESGSEAVRYDMKKKFNNDDLDWSIRMLDKYGISQTWLLIVGYPTETEKDFQDTMDMLRKYAHIARRTRRIDLVLGTGFMLTTNSPLLNNHDMAEEHGLLHNLYEVNHGRFWTSTKNPENTFPVRARRWRDLVGLAQELGYPWSHNMKLDTWKLEMEGLEKIYYEQQHENKTNKIFTLHPV